MEGCRSPAYSRGLCAVCYGIASRKVRRGEITWKELESRGLARQARTVSPMTSSINRTNRKRTSEIELKFFSSKSIDLLRRDLLARGWIPRGSVEQMNHYFDSRAGSLRTRYERKISSTREGVPRVYLVAKSGELHGSVRKEYELSVDSTLEQLDELLITAGNNLKSRWYRRRETLGKDGISICLDRNDGYGFVVEIEKMSYTDDGADESVLMIRTLADSLGLEEISKATLDKMYKHYTDNWSDYYRKGKTFNHHDI